MYKSKPVLLLKSLSASEIKELEKFIRSPFFNRNELLEKLFLLLKKEYPTFESPAIERTRLYQKLFGSEKFEESKLRYSFSDLSKLIEKFIVLKELDKSKIVQNQLLLEHYKNADLEKHFSQTLEDTRKILSQSDLQDSEYYFRKYILEESLYNYSSIRRDKSLDEILQHVADNLDYYYISKKLKFMCEMFTRQNFLNSEYKTPLIHELLEHVKNTDYSAFPAIHVYYRVLKTLIEEDNEENYRELLESLQTHGTHFNKDELRDLYFLAQNYCTKKINQGQQNYLREYFNLSIVLLEKELIYENGFIIPSTFKNIVTVGLRLEEFEWTENFIYTYKDRLAPKFRENAFTYNLAWLHFFKEEYKKTLRLLSNVEYMDVYYVLDSKCLLLKTYYELEEVDAFYSLVDSFYVYLRRNDLISGYQKTIFLNFVKFVKKLMRVRLGDRKAAQKLIDEIHETQQVASISWLLKKAESMVK